MSVMGNIHWINADGTERIEASPLGPTFNAMEKFVGGQTEHVSVLYNGYPASMFVHEFGRRQWPDRNPNATEIYFAASRARGVDPENEEYATQELLKLADSMGVPHENIVRLDKAEGMAKAPGIYGPAILLENFPI